MKYQLHIWKICKTKQQSGRKAIQHKTCRVQKKEIDAEVRGSK